MDYIKNKLFSNHYFCFFLLFTLACVVKWFYLAYQNYYIILLADPLPGAYSVAEQYSTIEILKKLFFDFRGELYEIARPFFPNLLYVLAIKLGGFHPHTVFLLGIMFGSLLVPLYYLIIAKLLNQEIALFSSLVLVFLTNYIEQSLALTTILPGIVFLALALIFAINYYRSHRLWRLYLSGFFLTISSLCRYENALFIPFFILYNLLFDKKTKTYLKVIYWVICLSSSIYICLYNLKLRGNPFYFIYYQSQDKVVFQLFGPIGLFKAGLEMWDKLHRLIGWAPIWVLGAGGMCFMMLKYKNKGLVIISSSLAFLAFLFYKIKSRTLWPEQNYFLILSLVIIPIALEFLRSIVLAILKKSIFPYIFLVITLGLLIRKFNNDNLIFARLRYPKELVRITEDLRNIPASSPLYILYDYNDRYLGPANAFSMLIYLKLDPMKYARDIELETNIIEDKSFYLLTPKAKISQAPGSKKVLVADYNDLGLYKVTNLQDNN